VNFSFSQINPIHDSWVPQFWQKWCTLLLGTKNYGDFFFPTLIMSLSSEAISIMASFKTLTQNTQLLSILMLEDLSLRIIGLIFRDCHIVDPP
jgi:hypothetical protein